MSTPEGDFNRQHLESFPSPALPQPRADTIDLYFFSFLRRKKKTGSEDKTKFKPNSRIQRLFLLFTAFEQAEFLDLRVRSRLPPGSHYPSSGLPSPENTASTSPRAGKKTRLPRQTCEPCSEELVPTLRPEAGEEPRKPFAHRKRFPNLKPTESLWLKTASATPARAPRSSLA